MILKTPLRYPGGKSKSTNKIFADLPEFKYYREPFLGGGSCALHISNQYGVPVWVNDKYYNLYCFWVALQQQPKRLYNGVLEAKRKADSYEDNVEAHRQLFIESRNRLMEDCDIVERGILFYIANKCSFSGIGESSGFSAQASQQNYTYAGIEKLAKYAPLIKNWLITNHDYKEVVFGAESNEFIFADPPYDIKTNLYGLNGNMHKGFNHIEFAEDIKATNANVLITYNANDQIRDLYQGWHCDEWDLTYTMRSDKMYSDDQKKRKELLIRNYG